MSQFTLLYGARQLLTLRGSAGARRGTALRDLGIIENGSVLIEDDLIFAVGPTRRIENLKQSRDAITVDVTGSIIMPGLIDPNFYLTSSIPNETANASPSRHAGQLYENGVTLMRSCLQHGTLAAVLKVSAEQDDFRFDISLLRLIDKIGTSNVDPVRTWHVGHPPETDDELKDFQETLSTLSRRNLVDSISVCSSATVPPPAYLLDVLDSKLPICLTWAGGPAELLWEMIQCLHPRSVACSSSISPEEIDVLVQSECIAVFAPGTEIGPTGGAMRALIDAGGAVALSSGHHPIEAPSFSMQMAISFAVKDCQLEPEEAICAATVNAAWAAGLGFDAGTLEMGKRADILVMTVPDYREIVRQFGSNHVGTVLRQGAIAFNPARSKIMSNESSAARMRS